jgi:hypothetical protein
MGPICTSNMAGMIGICHHAQLICWDGISLTFGPDWPLTMILLISASQVAGIIDSNHCTQPIWLLSQWTDRVEQLSTGPAHKDSRETYVSLFALCVEILWSLLRTCSLKEYYIKRLGFHYVPASFMISWIEINIKLKSSPGLTILLN